MNNREKVLKIKRVMKGQMFDDTGSLIIEASIILPIIIVVVLILITFSICVHDTYVSKGIVQVHNEGAHSVLVSNQIKERVIGGNIATRKTISKPETTTKITKYKQYYGVPFMGVKTQEFEDVESTTDHLKKIMMIEMTTDIIDELTFVGLDIDVYDHLKEVVLSGLEND